MKRLLILVAITLFAALSCEKDPDGFKPGKYRYSVSFDIPQISIAEQGWDKPWQNGDKLFFWFNDGPRSTEPDLVTVYKDGSWEIDKTVPATAFKPTSSGIMSALYTEWNSISSFTIESYESTIVYNLPYKTISDGTYGKVPACCRMASMEDATYTIKDGVLELDKEHPIIWNRMFNLELSVSGLPEGEWALAIDDAHFPTATYVEFFDDPVQVQLSYYTGLGGFQQGCRTDLGTTFFINLSSGDMIKRQVRLLNMTTDELFMLELSSDFDSDMKYSINSFKKTLPFEQFKPVRHDGGIIYIPMGEAGNWAMHNSPINSIYNSYYSDRVQWGDTMSYYPYDWTTYPFIDENDEREIDPEYKLNKYTFEDSNTPGSWYHDGKFIGDGKTRIEPEDDVCHWTLGGSWRLPTLHEWEKLMDLSLYNSSWDFSCQTYSHQGRIITDVKSSNSIFLPAEGYIYSSEYTFESDCCFYWSSELDTRYDSRKAAAFFSNYNTWGMVVEPRSYCMSVRCVTDKAD